MNFLVSGILINFCCEINEPDYHLFQTVIYTVEVSLLFIKGTSTYFSWREAPEICFTKEIL